MTGNRNGGGQPDKGVSATEAKQPALRPLSPEEALLERKVRGAARLITLERIWPRLWLPFAVCGVFVLISAFEVWQRLTPQLHEALLWGFGGAFALSFLPLFAVRKPDRLEAIIRLESSSGLSHRPVTAYTDTLAQPAAGPASEALWLLHKNRAARLLSRLKAGAFHPRVDKLDPFALRAALLLLLVAVFAWQSGGLTKRVAAAFAVPPATKTSDLRLDAWITPPAYTRKPPFILTNGGNNIAKVSTAQPAIEVPEGSELTFKINHPSASSFTLSYGEDGDPSPVERNAQSNETYAVFNTKLTQSGAISLHLGSEVLQDWRVTVQPDQDPTIEFTDLIEITQRSTLVLKYKTGDDYGAVTAEAHIERVENGIAPSDSATGGGQALSLTPEKAPAMRLGKPPVFALSLPRAPVKSGEAKTYKDLTAHPWAGLPVVITLNVRDEAGQTGHSAPRGFILPERKFTKPLARALIDQRRSLVENPARTRNALLNLEALSRWAASEEITPAIYLGIRSAFWRLQNEDSIETVESVVDQLWDLAVRIEDGDLPEAERELRTAQQKLMEALQRGAPEDEIQQLMSELQNAMNKFLQALAEQQQKQADGQTPVKPGERSISQDELQQLLRKIEELAKTGSRDMAQQMLSELQDILENLQSGGQQQGEEAGGSENLEQMEELEQILREQQKLLDETMRAQQNSEFGRDPFGEGDQSRQQKGEGQRGQQGRRQGQQQQAGEGSSQSLRQRQQDLRERLQELRESLQKGGNNPAGEQLQDADRAMGSAGEALSSEQFGEATGQETRALDALRQGAKSMAEQMGSSGGRNGRGQAGRDPLGRQQRGQTGDPGDSVKVPEEIDIQRAREILDELRRRLGQPSRPALELDYLERLIKRF